MTITQFLAVNYFDKKAPLQMFDKFLNALVTWAQSVIAETIQKATSKIKNINVRDTNRNFEDGFNLHDQISNGVFIHLL